MLETDNSRTIFSKNLQYFMSEKGVSRKDVCETLDISYYTFSDWCNGKKYPRVEKLEMLADYFGISVPELVSKKDESIKEELSKIDVQDKAKQEILDIILRLHSDKDFLEVVEKVNKFDNEKLKALVLFLKSFG